MKEFTVTAKDFAELLASTDKTVAAVALCEVDNGKATGRKGKEPKDSAAEKSQRRESRKRTERERRKNFQRRKEKYSQF